jgi:hypothetical protein
MKRLLLFLVVGVFATTTTTRAQNAGETGDLPSPPIPYNRPVKFESLTLEDGLLQGSVYAIHQDRRGFMWFGTQEGIRRYDGYTFKNFKHVPFDSTSAQTAWVVDIAEASDGSLWRAAAERRSQPAGPRHRDVHSTANTCGSPWRTTAPEFRRPYALIYLNRFSPQTYRQRHWPGAEPELRRDAGHGGRLDVKSADGRGAAFVPINGKTAVEMDAATAV